MIVLCIVPITPTPKAELQNVVSLHKFLINLACMWHDARDKKKIILGQEETN